MSKENDTWTAEDLLIDSLAQLAKSTASPAPYIRCGPKLAKWILPKLRLWEKAETLLSLMEDSIVAHEFENGEVADAALELDWDYTEFLSELRRTDEGGIAFWSEFDNEAIKAYRQVLMMMDEAKKA